MFRHVVSEIFQQCHLLVECLWKDFECVKELGAISLNVLHIPAPQTVELAKHTTEFTS